MTGYERARACGERDELVPCHHEPGRPSHLAVHARKSDRGLAGLVRGADIGANVEQNAHNLGVTEACSVVQRSIASEVGRSNLAKALAREKLDHVRVAPESSFVKRSAS